MPNIELIPPKERLIVQQLREFIETEINYSVALVSGMRKVGKTTALMQLKHSYGDKAVYVDLSINANDYEDILDAFISSSATVLLLDEISYVREFELMAQSLYNISRNSEGKDFKVILTGSSAAHLTKLADTKLGGRAKLFRLPVVTFLEYLYFTGRISSYAGYADVQVDDFADYLQLKGLKELNIQFDERYFDAYYKEVEIGNRQRGLSYTLVDLKSDDLQNMARLIAYKLNEPKVHKGIFEPAVGNQERGSLRGLTPPVTFTRGYNLSDAMIADSAKHVKGITAKDKGRILAFMLHAGLACVEFCDTGSGNDVKDIGHVLKVLENCEGEGQLINLIDTEKVSICLITPLLYTRLGEDILSRVGIETTNLYKGSLLGSMYEVYVRGASVLSSQESIMSSLKLRHTPIGEVDLCDHKKGLLLEATVGKKSAADVRVQKYFPNEYFVRVCATRDKSYFEGEFYRIQYAVLACMLDIGDIDNLSPTLAWSEEQRNNYNDSFNKHKTPADITSDIVLAFINDENNKHIGLMVWRHDIRQAEAVPMLSDFKSWNLDIVDGKLQPKICYINDFPVLTPIEGSKALTSGTVYNVKVSGAWVIGVYDNGVLRLMSTLGNVKNVTKETALPYCTKYRLANALFDATKGEITGKLNQLERIKG